MDMLPSEYIKVSYFWPKSAEKKKLIFFFKFGFFFHQINSKYHIWIVLTFRGTLDHSGRLQTPKPFPIQGRVKRHFQIRQFWQRLTWKEGNFGSWFKITVSNMLIILVHGSWKLWGHHSSLKAQQNFDITFIKSKYECTSQYLHWNYEING